MNQAAWQRAMGMRGYLGSPVERADRAAGIKVGGQCYWIGGEEPVCADILKIEVDGDGDPWFTLSFSDGRKDIRAAHSEIEPLSWKRL